MSANNKPTLVSLIDIQQSKVLSKRLPLRCEIVGSACTLLSHWLFRDGESISKPMNIEDEQDRKHGFPIEKILYGKMRYVASAPEHGEAFIIEKTHGSNHGIAKCSVLQGSIVLSHKQITTMSELVMNPESYWLGMPMYRRRPPRFTFAIRLYRDDQYLDILMDVGQNAGWAFFHSKGYYHNYLFNWIGTETKKLRDELFSFSLKRAVKNLFLGNSSD